MVSRERRLDRARRLARQWLLRFGEELREARLGAGLTQREIGRLAGISHSEVSRIERGLAPHVAYETLVRLGAVVGLDVPLRSFPVEDAVRDAAQIELLARLRRLLPRGLGWRTEVPLGVPGDRRAWDAVVEGPDWRVAVEAETRLRDVQACSRRIALKRRDDGRDVVILLVADTRTNRRALRMAADDLAAEYPVPGRLALAALAAGRRPEAGAIVIL